MTLGRAGAAKDKQWRTGHQRGGEDAREIVKNRTWRSHRWLCTTRHTWAKDSVGLTVARTHPPADPQETPMIEGLRTSWQSQKGHQNI